MGVCHSKAANVDYAAQNRGPTRPSRDAETPSSSNITKVNNLSNANPPTVSSSEPSRQNHNIEDSGLGVQSGIRASHRPCETLNIPPLQIESLRISANNKNNSYSASGSELNLARNVASNPADSPKLEVQEDNQDSQQLYAEDSHHIHAGKDHTAAAYLQGTKPVSIRSLPSLAPAMFLAAIFNDVEFFKAIPIVRLALQVAYKRLYEALQKEKALEAATGLHPSADAGSTTPIPLSSAAPKSGLDSSSSPPDNPINVSGGTQSNSLPGNTTTAITGATESQLSSAKISPSSPPNFTRTSPNLSGIIGPFPPSVGLPPIHVHRNSNHSETGVAATPTPFLVWRLPEIVPSTAEIPSELRVFDDGFNACYKEYRAHIQGPTHLNEILQCENQFGETILQVAAAAGSVDVLELFLFLKPQLVHTHISRDTGNTLLHFAMIGPSSFRSFELVKAAKMHVVFNCDLLRSWVREHLRTAEEERLAEAQRKMLKNELKKDRKHQKRRIEKYDDEKVKKRANLKGSKQKYVKRGEFSFLSYIHRLTNAYRTHSDLPSEMDSSHSKRSERSDGAQHHPGHSESVLKEYDQRMRRIRSRVREHSFDAYKDLRKDSKHDISTISRTHSRTRSHTHSRSGSKSTVGRGYSSDEEDEASVVGARDEDETETDEDVHEDDDEDDDADDVSFGYMDQDLTRYRESIQFQRRYNLLLNANAANLCRYHQDVAREHRKMNSKSSSNLLPPLEERPGADAPTPDQSSDESVGSPTASPSAASRTSTRGSKPQLHAATVPEARSRVKRLSISSHTSHNSHILHGIPGAEMLDPECSACLYFLRHYTAERYPSCIRGLQSHAVIPAPFSKADLREYHMRVLRAFALKKRESRMKILSTPLSQSGSGTWLSRGNATPSSASVPAHPPAFASASGNTPALLAMFANRSSDTSVLSASNPATTPSTTTTNSAAAPNSFQLLSSAFTHRRGQSSSSDHSHTGVLLPRKSSANAPLTQTMNAELNGTKTRHSTVLIHSEDSKNKASNNSVAPSSLEAKAFGSTDTTPSGETAPASASVAASSIASDTSIPTQSHLLISAPPKPPQAHVVCPSGYHSDSDTGSESDSSVSTVGSLASSSSVSSVSTATSATSTVTADSSVCYSHLFTKTGEMLPVLTPKRRHGRYVDSRKHESSPPEEHAPNRRLHGIASQPALMDEDKGPVPGPRGILKPSTESPSSVRQSRHFGFLPVHNQPKSNVEYPSHTDHHHHGESKCSNSSLHAQNQDCLCVEGFTYLKSLMYYTKQYEDGILNPLKVTDALQPSEASNQSATPTSTTKTTSDAVHATSAGQSALSTAEKPVHASESATANATSSVIKESEQSSGQLTPTKSSTLSSNNSNLFTPSKQTPGVSPNSGNSVASSFPVSNTASSTDLVPRTQGTLPSPSAPPSTSLVPSGPSSTPFIAFPPSNTNSAIATFLATTATASVPSPVTAAAPTPASTPNASAPFPLSVTTSFYHQYQHHHHQGALHNGLSSAHIPNASAFSVTATTPAPRVPISASILPPFLTSSHAHAHGKCEAMIATRSEPLVAKFPPPLREIPVNQRFPRRSVLKVVEVLLHYSASPHRENIHKVTPLQMCSLHATNQCTKGLDAYSGIHVDANVLHDPPWLHLFTKVNVNWLELKNYLQRRIAEES